MEEWCIPTASAEFVAKIEDVLDVYERPYDPVRTVVCIDEVNKRSVQETRLPCEPGQPEEIRPLAEYFEWHYTPKHGSWLDMAEIEIRIMCRQALAKHQPDLDPFRHQVRSWTLCCDLSGGKVNWQFRAADARVKCQVCQAPFVYSLIGN